MGRNFEFEKRKAILDGMSIVEEMLEKVGKKGDSDMYNSKSESGYFDLPTEVKCNDRSHNPPSHLHIPYGKGYRHVCPRCKNVIIITSPNITL